MNTAELVNNPDAEAVLTRNCIRLGTAEILPIKFKTAVTVLNNPDLVTAVQDEFARSVSENGTVDFPVFEIGEHRYYYINEYGNRTDITELYRKQTDETTYDYIVMAGGKRKFGYYDVIIHLRITDLDDLGILYSVKVHAWPHSWFTRTANRIGLTRSYFKNNMQFISWVARKVAIGLCKQEEQKQALAEVHTPTALNRK
ncbi:hypothetical protein EGM51_09660 [Verrucomicrobia bacterium S94]|nr:hypothetical protein EGM51_09660 [Verrucomicrobia bacterium S94]